MPTALSPLILYLPFFLNITINILPQSVSELLAYTEIWISLHPLDFMPFSSLPMLWFDNMRTLIIAITEHITRHLAFLTENLLLSILLPVKKSRFTKKKVWVKLSDLLLTTSNFSYHARTSGFWLHKRQTWKAGYQH